MAAQPEPTRPGRPLDPSTALGICAALAALLLGLTLEGGTAIAFVQPAAAVIVFGGTIGATIASSGVAQVAGMARLARVSMTYRWREVDRARTARVIVQMAERARREGLLALEEGSAAIDDDLLRKGVMLVVDGADPELVKDVLESDVEAMGARHARGAALFATAGGFAPTLGIIGTVMGLVHVLGNLNDPASLGPAISTAFIATFYGVASANLVYLPIANKLREISHHELTTRAMIIEGIISIQAGDNPRIVQEKLETFLEPGDRAMLGREDVRRRSATPLAPGAPGADAARPSEEDWAAA